MNKLFCVNDTILDWIASNASRSERGRANLNLSISPSDHLQALLNAITRESYIRPHKHKDPAKSETLVALRGDLTVVEFDDLGEINDAYRINKNGPNYLVHVHPNTWHTVVPISPLCIVYEAISGPFDPSSHKIFADWAPIEDSEESKQYYSDLRQKISKFLYSKSTLAGSL